MVNKDEYIKPSRPFSKAG